MKKSKTPTEKVKWSEKKVGLAGAIAAVIIMFAGGVVLGANWENLWYSWGPYLGLTRKIDKDIDLSSIERLYRKLATYYDGDLDKEKLLDGAKKGLVAAAGDEYTTFMNSSEATNYLDSLDGSIKEAGIGIEFGKREDYIKVIRTLPDNPARRAGVLAGDIIFAVDDEEVWDKDAEYISGKLRGKAGDKVKLTVVRDNKKKDFELTREKINNVSADITYDGKTAIISVYRFSSDTGTLVSSFQKEMKEKGVEKIILDLRNNGGGYVSAAKDLLSLWISGEKIFTQKGKDGSDNNTYASRDKNVFKDMKTVVLVNESTASASEIVAGALKDYGKATIIGKTTFGKGVVQQMLNVEDGGILKVTIARWYTPNGTSINGSGIKPDIEVDRTYEQINKDQDPQLDRAKQEIK
ncbi:MAG: S41 family peptidase [Candidatus Saccharibacteria bacterium]|nr:S41 family peptidase [Candidatus Saccharibacteria bacterium]